MTKQSEILNNDNYRPCLDKGFIGIVDSMGSDSSIVRAARVSYGSGTKSVREDRGLIRYLIRHKHTSPIEMCNITFHVKLPMFIANQWVRHRTFSYNFLSARYSVMEDDFYIPARKDMKPQSSINKQGREGELSDDEAFSCIKIIEEMSEQSYQEYLTLMNSEDGDLLVGIEDRQGLSRELSRSVLPMNLYTEMYCNVNLHNLLHFLRLRADHHAQWEIQVYANAIIDLVKDKFPLVMEAFEDYIKNSTTFSYMENSLLSDIINISNSNNISFNESYLKIITSFGNEEEFLSNYKLSKSEFKEFKNKFKI